MATSSNNATVVSTTPSTILPTTSLTAPTISSTSLSIPTSSSLPPTSISSSVSISTPTPSSSPSVNVVTSVVIASPTVAGQTGQITTIFSTSTRSVAVPTSTASTGSTTGSAAAATSAGAPVTASNDQASGPGLSTGGTIAVAVIVPVVAILLLILAGLWFWRKRKNRKEAEDLRRKEMEEYGYNPNNDPTLPAVAAGGVGGSANGDEPSTMRERDAGYRGWGATSTQRKASTTMSSQPGVARSDSGGNGYTGQPSPTAAMTHSSDVQSNDPLVSPTNDETIGALGAAPAAGSNRQNGINRGPSNASSAYSGANRSDVSSDGPLPSGSPPYHDGFMYQEEAAPNGIGQAYGGGYDGQPVIRDVSARRNTRIESPSVVPQQGNAGIAQNF